jgi:hypothetical protein
LSAVIFLAGNFAEAGTFLYQDDFETDKAKYESLYHSPFVIGPPPPIRLYDCLCYEPSLISGRGLGFYEGFEVDSYAYLAYATIPQSAISTGGSIQFFVMGPGSMVIYGSANGNSWTFLGITTGWPPHYYMPIRTGDPVKFLKFLSEGQTVIDNLEIRIEYRYSRYSGGTGTPEDPYRIATPEDLLALAADTGDYGKYFVLIADIDLDSNLPGNQIFTAAVIAPDTNNANWEFDGVAFSGVFDGAGHKIINLTINTNGVGNDFLGLFGDIGYGGEVKNLCLENVITTGGNESIYLGGLVGYTTVSSSISNCYSTGDVAGGNNSGRLGGLVGNNDGGNISNCYSTGNVTGTYSLGGLVGCHQLVGSISNCYSTGAVTGGAGSSNIGGLAGHNEGSISNCHSTGDVAGGVGSPNLGGLVGVNTGSIINCYSTGNVTGTYDLGGLVGVNTGSISDCYFLDTSGPDNDLGEPLTDTQMKKQSSFVGWDFVGETANGPNDIWAICEGVSFPKLAWQLVPIIVSPLPNAVLAGGAILTAEATANGGDVYFYLREPNDGNGTPIGYEDLSADFNTATGKWEYNLDTTLVSNGSYIILAKAADGFGNTGLSEPMPVTISNTLPSTIQVTKCSVAAGSKDNSDKISISGNMDATADDFNGVSVIEVTVDSNDMVNPLIQTFPINETTFKNGKYNYARTENASKRLFKYDTKNGKFSFMAKNVDLLGLGCPLTIEIKVGNYVGVGEADEDIVNGPKKPIPIQLMMGVKNSLRLDKYKVKHGTKPNTDGFSVKGGFSVEDPNVSMANRVSEGLVVTVGTQQFTIDANDLEAGEDKFTFKNAPVKEGGLASGGFNFKTCVFTIAIKNFTITPSFGAGNFCVEFYGFSECVPIVLP